MIEKYIPNLLSVCAGCYMLKWADMNNIIHNHDVKILPGDKVNIFISVESIMKNLFMRKDVNRIAQIYKQNAVLEIESAIMNVVAHYRGYFLKERCRPQVYLYYTELSDAQQQMEVYNPEYRSFYRNKYLKEPMFYKMGELLKDIIIPEVKLILSYVDGCYLISSRTFDSSLIPKIISDFDDSKNVLITGDIFDTLYLHDPRFITIYIHRSGGKLVHLYTTQDVVSSIIKEPPSFETNIFNSEMYFRLLLSIRGNKIRNIKTARGFGYGSFIKIMHNGIANGNILQDFGSLESILMLFPPKYRDDIKLAFQCTSIELQASLLSETDISFIKDQIIDKSDPTSVEALNNQRFIDSPINLQGLLG